MFQHALKDICVGKNSGRPLDPSDIEFRFYSFGRHTNEDGEIDEYPSFELITHTYDECSKHNISVQNISKSEDVDIAKVHLLSKELCDIVTTICQNSNITEDEYIELLFDSLDEWINEGYTILSQYDLEVEEDDGEDSKG